MWVSSQAFHIISKPRTCAKFWIKHLVIVIATNSTSCKFQDQAWTLVYVLVKGTYYEWIVDLPNDLMVNLKIIITLASMIYIVNLDAYKLHLGKEKYLQMIQ